MCVAKLLADASCVAASLPAAATVMNLCEDRYRFMVTFCAALMRGCTTLLPQSRATQVIDELASAYPGCVRCGDEYAGDAKLRQASQWRAASMLAPLIAADQWAVVLFTSGSTGPPIPHRKSWRSLTATTLLSAERIRASLPRAADGVRPWIVATMPSQHTFGLEMSVLLPLLGDMGVSAARPLFPADVAAALSAVQWPRVLVSTPVHLRALVESSQEFPDVALVLTATASLDPQLAEIGRAHV